MTIPMTSAEVLNREFLEVRAKILEVSACLDRLDRAEGETSGDTRLDRIHEALAVLRDGEAGRAEQIQMIFSREYDAAWQSNFFPGS